MRTNTFIYMLSFYRFHSHEASDLYKSILAQPFAQWKTFLLHFS